MSNSLAGRWQWLIVAAFWVVACGDDDGGGGDAAPVDAAAGDVAAHDAHPHADGPIDGPADTNDTRPGLDVNMNADGPADAPMAPDVVSSPDAPPGSGTISLEDGPCRFVGAMPFATQYLAPLSTPEGLWVAATKMGVVFRRVGNRWEVARSEGARLLDPNQGFRTIVGGPGFVALSGGLVWRNGQWTKPFDDVSSIHAAGADLFLGRARSIVVTDGTNQTTIPTAGAVTSMAGDRKALYAFINGNLHRIVNGGAAEVIFAPVGVSLGAIATAGAQAYALGSDGKLYQIVGDRTVLASVQPPECASSVSTSTSITMTGGDGRILVSRDCGSTTSLWSFEGNEFKTLASPPFKAAALRIGEGGHVFASGANGGEIAHFDGTTWRTIQGDVKSGPYTGVVGRAANDWYAWGTGLARFDGKSFADVTNADPRTPLLSAWYAPEGELFIVAETDGARFLVRYTPNAATRFAEVRDAYYVTGRTNKDVYLGTSGDAQPRQLFKWDGVALTQAPPPCSLAGSSSRPYPLRIFPLDMMTVLIRCNDAPLLEPYKPLPCEGDVLSVGPPATPSLYCLTRTPHGSFLFNIITASGMLAGGESPYEVIGGPSRERLVGYKAGEVGRSNTGLAGPWTTWKSALVDAPNSQFPRRFSFWTDGRTVVMPNNALGGVTMCDLGP